MPLSDADYELFMCVLHEFKEMNVNVKSLIKEVGEVGDNIYLTKESLEDLYRLIDSNIKKDNK